MKKKEDGMLVDGLAQVSHTDSQEVSAANAYLGILTRFNASLVRRSGSGRLRILRRAWIVIVGLDFQLFHIFLIGQFWTAMSRDQTYTSTSLLNFYLLLSTSSPLPNVQLCSGIP